MFAVIQTGGKQYKVSENQVLDVEKLDRAEGDQVELDVLMVSDGKTVKTGTPVLSNVKCVAEVVAHGKADKIVVFKYKPKKNIRKKQGHRQPFTRIKIVSIK
jgi:large subunit ribosomal protein L21